MTTTITCIEKDGKKYRVVTKTTEIDIKALQTELDELRAQKPPSKDELIDMGCMIHPYYTEREMRIGELECQIANLEEQFAGEKEP